MRSHFPQRAGRRRALTEVNLWKLLARSRASDAELDRLTLLPARQNERLFPTNSCSVENSRNIQADIEHVQELAASTPILSAISYSQWPGYDDVIPTILI